MQQQNQERMDRKIHRDWMSRQISTSLSTFQVLLVQTDTYNTVSIKISHFSVSATGTHKPQTLRRWDT